MKKTRILIVDDHQMVRDGIRSMLEFQEKKHTLLIEEADTGEISIEKARKTEYDLIIMDYQLPKINGCDATISILIDRPSTKILAVSNYDEYMHIINILRAGAKGFVLKNIGPEELLNAIETILGGKNYYSNDVANKLINFDPDIPKTSAFLKTEYSITKREMEILKFIVLGKTNMEIANELCISSRTVGSHRQHLLHKLNAKNSIELIKFAVEYNLLT